MQHLIRNKDSLVNRPVFGSGRFRVRKQEWCDVQHLCYYFTTMSKTARDSVRFCSAGSHCFHNLPPNKPNIRLWNGSLFLRNKFFALVERPKSKAHAVRNCFKESSPAHPFHQAENCWSGLCLEQLQPAKFLICPTLKRLKLDLYPHILQK